MSSPPWGRHLSVLVGLVILAITLVPATASEAGAALACVVCGERGMADALLNVCLFVPLGSAFRFSGWPFRRAGLYGALFSSCIEFAQLFIGGRDASVGDVLFNTLGTVLGVFIIHAARMWTRPEPGVASRLSLAAAGVACGVSALTGYLLQPSFPPSVYYGQWTANLGHLAWYHGRVLHASLGELAIPSRRLWDSDRVRQSLVAGESLHVRGLAGPTIPRLGPLLSIYDEQEREIILLGPDRDDIVYRYRTRAAALGLDQPDLRVRRAVRGISPGDSVQVTVWRGNQGYCMAVNTAVTCNLGNTVGHAWSVLLYPEHFPSWLQKLLDIGWLVALTGPIGLWARMRWESALAGLVLVTGMTIIPPALGLLETPLAQLGAALLGAAIGVGVQRSIARRPN